MILLLLMMMMTMTPKPFGVHGFAVTKLFNPDCGKCC
jgi:hypothetical protein